MKSVEGLVERDIVQAAQLCRRSRIESATFQAPMLNHENECFQQTSQL
jgi:hypothetical protein